jgi:hypothetical protein
MLKLLIIIRSFLFSLFYVVDKRKANEEAMEDLHKVGVHDLNNEFI